MMIKLIVFLLGMLPVKVAHELRRRWGYYYGKIENLNYNFSENGERWLLQLIAEHCAVEKVSPILLDVGANKGQYSTVALEVFTEMNVIPEIFCFEPAEKSFEALSNGLRPKGVKCENLGLWGQPCQMPLAKRSATSERNTFVPELSGFNYIGYETTELIRGDDFFVTRGLKSDITLLKIDTEGSELEVMKGFSNLLHASRIHLIQFERASSAGTLPLREYFDFLSQYNFTIGKLYPNYIELIESWNCYLEERIGSNWIAINRNSTMYLAIMTNSISFQSPLRHYD